MIGELSGPIKIIKRLRDDFGEGWQEQADFLLAQLAKEYIGGDKMSPEQAAAKLLRVLTDEDGSVIVSKAQIRHAVAQGYNDFKEERAPGEGGKVRLATFDKDNFLIDAVPTTPEEHMARLITEVENWKNLEGYGFGIWDLDTAFGGLYPSELLALVGAPGSMKTALALNAVDDFLRKNKTGRVLFFSLDMPAQTIHARRLMRELNCSQGELYRMIKSKDQAVKEAQHLISQNDAGRFRLIGKPRGGRPYTWNQVQDIIIQLAPDLVIVDYLTLIGTYRSELDCVIDLMPKIKSIADDLGIAMILLSQMGRSSRAAQKSGSGGHAAGGHYVEDAVDVELELLKDENQDGDSAIVATVTKTRKNQSGKSFALDFKARSLSFGGTADKVTRSKPPVNVFNI